MNNYYTIDIIVLLFTLFGCGENDNSVLTQPEMEESETEAFNRWVYGEMNHHYLWRTDLPDSVNCDYSLTETEFFKNLLSEKDRFSYMTTNSSWSAHERYQDIGFQYQIYRDQCEREAMQILYIQDEDAYASSGLKRGDFVALSSKSGNKIKLHRIEVTDGFFNKSDGDDITIYLSDFGKYKSTVQTYKIFEADESRIGYVCYLEYGEKNDIAKVLCYFYENNITDLILDLRYNPGGYVSTCKYLCNCIIPETGYNKVFQRCSYNEILASENILATGSPYTFDLYESPQNSTSQLLGHGLYPLKLNRLFVITSKNTASASEATIICLRPFIEVVIIGESTMGKGVGSYTLSNPKYRRAIQPITMRYFNANNETTPDNGLDPNYYIPDGYSTSKSQLGNIDEPLLYQGLSMINPSVYPPIPNSRSGLHNLENTLIPIGEPSYVIEFYNKHYNENN